ncbi:hypothetical protein BKA70DRAFT_1307958 [Coprinopsis sp. MPI-PUGE-AT-0042]|nr:hypothetical protein BKA70DRAFT_1307958 [Coprinopsis sp. MPI-PUGE-AT-0042]
MTGHLRSLISAVPPAMHHYVEFLRVTGAASGSQLTESWEELLDVVSVTTSSIGLRDDGAGGRIPLGALRKVVALDNQLFCHLCLSAKHKSVRAGERKLAPHTSGDLPLVLTQTIQAYVLSDDREPLSSFLSQPEHSLDRSWERVRTLESSTSESREIV